MLVNRSIVLITFLASLFIIHSTALAAVIYDESVSGDAGAWFGSTYEVLGNISSGDTVLGSINASSAHGDYWDGWSFDYLGQIDSITISMDSGYVANGWQMYALNDPSIPLISDYLNSGIGVETITFNLSTLGSGEYLLGNADNSFLSNYSYELVFSSRNVPEPSVLALIGVSLFGLRIIGGRKKPV